MCLDCLSPGQACSPNRGTLNSAEHQSAAGADRPCRSIALFSGYYPSHGGGIELVCGDLVEGLCGLGMTVDWVALKGGPHQTHARCTLRPIQGSDLVYRWLGIPFPLVNPVALRRIWAAVRKADVAVVAEANFMISVLAFVIAKLQDRPVLLVQHVGAPSTVSAVAGAAMRTAELLMVRPMLRAADWVVYVSPAVENYFAAVRTRHSPEVIGHGVDPDVFSPPTSHSDKSLERRRFGLDPDRPVACFAGRCTATKGIQVFMRMAQLRPRWQFVVAGEGPIDPGSGNSPNLTTLGRVDRATLARLYRASDVLVLPSRSESFSLVVREALAAGAGVLCEDQILETDPGLRRFVVTRPVDLAATDVTAKDFSVALDEARPCSPEEARSYVIERCSWPRIAARYAGLIERLIEESRKHPTVAST